MWLLAIDVIAAIVASARGWGVRPFILLGTTFIVGIIFGLTGTYSDTIVLASILDWIIAAILVGMAIIGKSSSDSEETSSGKRKCPYCAERIQPEAQVCKHCGRDLPPAFIIPAKYAFQNLPPSEAQAISSKSSKQNLSAAKVFIKEKKYHQGIASLQFIIENESPNSQIYSEAYGLLYEMSGNYKSASVQETKQEAVPSVTKPTQQSNDISEDIVTSTPYCPVCGVPMDIRTAKKGKLKGKRFYVCPNFSECRQAEPLD